MMFAHYFNKANICPSYIKPFKGLRRYGADTKLTDGWTEGGHKECNYLVLIYYTLAIIIVPAKCAVKLNIRLCISLASNEASLICVCVFMCVYF